MQPINGPIVSTKHASLLCRYSSPKSGCSCRLIQKAPITAAALSTAPSNLSIRLHRVARLLQRGVTRCRQRNHPVMPPLLWGHLATGDRTHAATDRATQLLAHWHLSLPELQVDIKLRVDKPLSRPSNK
jgi:hypothetical protein